MEVRAKKKRKNLKIFTLRFWKYQHGKDPPIKPEKRLKDGGRGKDEEMGKLVSVTGAWGG